MAQTRILGAPGRGGSRAPLAGSSPPSSSPGSPRARRLPGGRSPGDARAPAPEDRVVFVASDGDWPGFLEAVPAALRYDEWDRPVLHPFLAVPDLSPYPVAIETYVRDSKLVFRAEGPLQDGIPEPKELVDELRQKIWLPTLTERLALVSSAGLDLATAALRRLPDGEEVPVAEGFALDAPAGGEWRGEAALLAVPEDAIDHLPLRDPRDHDPVCPAAGAHPQLDLEDLPPDAGPGRAPERLGGARLGRDGVGGARVGGWRRGRGEDDGEEGEVDDGAEAGDDARRRRGAGEERGRRGRTPPRTLGLRPRARPRPLLPPRPPLRTPRDRPAGGRVRDRPARRGHRGPRGRRMGRLPRRAEATTHAVRVCAPVAHERAARVGDLRHRRVHEVERVQDEHRRARRSARARSSARASRSRSSTASRAAARARSAAAARWAVTSRATACASGGRSARSGERQRRATATSSGSAPHRSRRAQASSSLACEASTRRSFGSPT